MNGRFWADALERSIRTFAQALIAVLGAGLVITDSAQWGEAILTAAVAALLSLLTSVAGSTVGNSESPSIVTSVQEATTHSKDSA